VVLCLSETVVTEWKMRWEDDYGYEVGKNLKKKK
jgi:hypothetical protein